jgi:cell division protease FtsH
MMYSQNHLVHRLRAGLLAALMVVAAHSAHADAGSRRSITFSEVMQLGRAGKIASIHMDGDREASITLTDGSQAVASTPSTQTWAVDLATAGVEVAFDPTGQGWSGSLIRWLGIAGQIFGIVMTIGLLGWLASTMRGKFSAGEFLEPGRDGNQTLFDHVAGAEEGKAALADIVDYLKSPAKFKAVGARARKGVLLVGDPGNGKTLLAKAVAGEAGVPFLAVSGASFQEMFAGLGAARVRSMFKKLRKAAPCILFIDEIDSVGRKRSESSSAVENDSANTLNELLTQLDGLASAQGIVVIGATNRIDVLDPALIRAGRFDLHITVPAPDMKARESILKVSARNVQIGPDVDFRIVARGTPGFSGADLATLVNEAAIRAGKCGRLQVTMEDFEAARDVKLLGGEERSGLFISATELETIIYHESGHALASVLQPECDPIHKGTVAPRGRSLGHIASLPLADRVLIRKSKLHAELVMALAGRAAEELVFGEDMITTGAAADIEHATGMAREMIARYGMGSTMASRVDGANAFSARPISERSKQHVDEEVEHLLRDSYAKAKALLQDNRAALDALAQAFRERETLEGDEIRDTVHAALQAKRTAQAAAA